MILKKIRGSNNEITSNKCYQIKYHTNSYYWLTIIYVFYWIINRSDAGFACLSNPCVFGVCIDDLNSTYSCYCIDGYTGIQCQTNWDECWSSPCQNGATCIDGVAQYNCSCPDGFVGQNCEENLDECLSNPCQNGGICNDKDNGYTCTCQIGYLGTFCEIDVAVCETGNGERCHNGAECIEGKGLEFECMCSAGWSGLYCDNEINECDSAPCQNGGICIDKLASYSCACSLGYTGNDCTEEVMVCEESPCSNNALCLMEEGLPICYCVPDFHGEKCEYQYDECQLSPSRCLNGGTCIDGIDDFTCSCPPGLTGIYCECLMLDNGDLDCNYTIPFEEPTATTTTVSELETEIISTTLTTILDTSYITDDSTKIVTSTTTSKSLDITKVPNITDTITILSTTIDNQETTTTTTIPSTTTTMEILTNMSELDTTYVTSELTTTTGYDENISITPTNQISTIQMNETIVDTTITPDTLNIRSTTIQDDTKSATDTAITSTIDNDFTEQTTPLESTVETEQSTNIRLNTTLPTFSQTISTETTIKTVESTLSTFFTEYPESITTSTTTISTSSPPPPPTIPSSETTITSEKTPTFTTNPVVDDDDNDKMNVTTIQPVTIEKTTIESVITTKFTTELTPPSMENTTGIPDCFKIPCLNGGTCIETGQETKCSCRFNRKGVRCEKPIKIYSAAFAGDSFLSHPILQQPGGTINYNEVITTSDDNNINDLSIKIEIKGRTRGTDGLIFLALSQGLKGTHYMALFLHKGLLQFQFSCGLQTMLLSELETPINTGNEIMIQAELDFSRNLTHCNASLRVNDTLAMSGDQPTWINLLGNEIKMKKIIQNTWLHLGGTPQAPVGLINDIPAGGQGFTGCLHSLKINGIAQDIFSDAVDGFGITECGSLACLSNPCRNGAICIEIDDDDNNNNNDNGDSVNKNEQNIYNKIMENENNKKQMKTNDKWKCKCPTGYMGPTCEISVCDDNPCQYGATCVTFPGSGYLCLCPLGKHGHYCEHNLEIAQPHFSGSINGLSSYIAYPVPLPLEYSIELNFKIFPSSMHQIALLAFLGQTGYHDEKSDHLAVSFIQGYIMLTWNLGSGPRRIFTQKPIEFHDDGIKQAIDIKIGRIGRQAWLSVDGKINITGRSPGALTRMDVLPMLFLGGHEIANFSTLPHDLPLHYGFQGCIYDVQLKAGLVTVPLQETRGVRGRGVGQCGTRECHKHSCQNDGACLHHGSTFSCICQDEWYGPLCTQSKNLCDSDNNRCSDKATCVPLISGYECDCSIGQTGRYCEKEIKSLSDVSFTGRRSFIIIQWPNVLNYPEIDNEIGYDRLRNLYKNQGTKNSNKYRNYPMYPVSSMKFLKQFDGNITSNQLPTLPVPPTILNENVQHHRVQYFSIEFQIRTLSERGLLFYFGELNDNQDHNLGFVSLSLQGGVVEFRLVAVNQHLTVLRSVRMLAIGEWHKIKITQSGRRLSLLVDNNAATAITTTSEILLNKDSLIFIGGLPDLSRLPYNAISGFPVPFRGCLRQLLISGVRIVLNETNILASRNINDCDGTPCGGDSCELGGQCWIDDTLQPHCKCPEYLKGDRCEYQESCKYFPCKNNGKCTRNGECNCPNGWTGFYCEIATTKNFIPSFNGKSYLVVPPSTFSLSPSQLSITQRIPGKDKRHGSVLYIKSKDIKISLNFSTISIDGLLFWTSTSMLNENSNNYNNNQLMMDQFLGLGISNGHIKLASNLLSTNSKTIDIPSGGFIADGGWHNVQIEINRQIIQLSIDGRIIFTENKKIVDINDNNNYNIINNNNTYSNNKNKHKNNINNNNTNMDDSSIRNYAINNAKFNNITNIGLKELFYIGGFPDGKSVANVTYNMFTKSFSGCIQDIQFDNYNTYQIKDFSIYNGENIGICDMYDNT